MNQNLLKQVDDSSIFIKKKERKKLQTGGEKGRTDRILRVVERFSAGHGGVDTCMQQTQNG